MSFGQPLETFRIDTEECSLAITGLKL